MPEYIEREALLAELEDEIDFVSPFYNAEQNQYFTMGLRCAYRDAQRFPTAADVVEVRHGKWIENSCYNICSVCEKYVHAWNDDGDLQEFAYCPHCGAKMDGGNNNA